MKERAMHLLQDSTLSRKDDLWIGTFHSLALRMLRPHHDKINRSSKFSILDSDDQLRIIKKVLKDANWDDGKYPPKSIAYHINRWKDLLLSPNAVSGHAKKYTSEEIAARVYDFYEKTLTSLDAIDFGDILMYCIDVFKRNQDVLNFYQEKFKYIMVDEYQDTNTAQYMWLRLLSMYRENICCVGDDDQSIYSWRGADIGNILRFEHDFKKARIIRLEQNYRSTANILKTASSIVAHNHGRMGKNLWTESENGLPVIVKSLSDPANEASFIANLIENKKKNGTPYSEISILVRAAFQTRAFEERFLSVGIPYKIIGGLRFYERKEVKDIVAYLRLIVNPNDGIAFERVVNLPKRGIGIGTINKLYAIAKEKGISFTDAAKMVAGEKLIYFFDMVEKWRKEMPLLSPANAVNVVMKESGYMDMLKQGNPTDCESRIETIKELINALQGFENVEDFLEYVSLVLDNNDQIVSEKVIISTIHAAKGLEYQTVFIPGFEENIMPHQKAIEEKGDFGIEEERRICYVAITRAKKEAYITFCNTRGSFFRDSFWQRVNPSRFLNDLPRANTRFL
jgi:DNA helicase-2/ATP-dependent DNA helicase PcrA